MVPTRDNAFCSNLAAQSTSNRFCLSVRRAVSRSCLNDTTNSHLHSVKGSKPSFQVVSLYGVMEKCSKRDTVLRLASEPLESLESLSESRVTVV